MGKIKVTPCDIKGLYVIEPTVFKDERGYFVETYNQNGQPVHVGQGRVKGPAFPETVSPGQAGPRRTRDRVRRGGRPAL